MKKCILLSLMLGTLPLTMMAQDDDMYFVPTKKNAEKARMEYYGLPRDTYYRGSNRSVDEYNRRTPDGGSYYEVLPDSLSDVIMFDGQMGVYPDSTQQDFAATREMSRWDGYEPTFWDGYNAGRRDGAMSWHSPWFYSSYYPWYTGYYGWYDPWYGGYYDPWYYGYYGYYGPWYYGSYYGWYDPWYYGGFYGGSYYTYNGPSGSQRHGQISYNPPRGISNGRSTTYANGTFGGSRVGSFGRTSTSASRSYGTSARTTSGGVTRNANGNFGGSRARTGAPVQSSTRTYTPPVTTSSTPSYSSGSSVSSGGSGGGSFGGSRSGGGGSRSGGGGGFGGRR